MCDWHLESLSLKLWITLCLKLYSWYHSTYNSKHSVTYSFKGIDSCSFWSTVLSDSPSKAKKAPKMSRIRKKCVSRNRQVTTEAESIYVIQSVVETGLTVRKQPLRCSCGVVLIKLNLCYRWISGERIPSGKNWNNGHRSFTLARSSKCHFWLFFNQLPSRTLLYMLIENSPF